MTTTDPARDAELLREAAEALRSFSLRALTVRPTLDVPYRDEPRTSPWRQYVEPEARRAHDLARTISKHLAATGAPLPAPAAECRAPRFGDDAAFATVPREDTRAVVRLARLSRHIAEDPATDRLAEAAGEGEQP